MKNREQQLLQLGFTKNNDQQSFNLSKYDSHWYVDFWKISDYTDHKWNILIEDIKYDLEMVKKQWYDDLKQHPAYNFAVKKIKNKLNALKSKLAEEKTEKISKRINKEKIRELEIRIETIKELMKCT